MVLSNRCFKKGQPPMPKNQRHFISYPQHEKRGHKYDYNF